MILYYAPGGGIGHLARASAVIDALALPEPVNLVATSEFASDPRICASRAVHRPPDQLARDPAGLRDWIESLLRQLGPRLVYVDAFPGGIIGEWCGLSVPAGTQVHHIARLLRWERYRQRLTAPLPRFDSVRVLEPLAARHERCLAQHTFDLQPLALAPGTTAPCGLAPESLLAPFTRPVWLVVHSGPPAECRALLDYAAHCAALEGQRPQFVLVSPRRLESPPGNTAHLDIYPASGLFPFVDCVVSACGFNVMYQAHGLATSHRFLPFERPLDDQFKRAAAYRSLPRMRAPRGSGQRQP